MPLRMKHAPNSRKIMKKRQIQCKTSCNLPIHPLKVLETHFFQNQKIMIFAFFTKFPADFTRAEKKPISPYFATFGIFFSARHHIFPKNNQNGLKTFVLCTELLKDEENKKY